MEISKVDEDDTASPMINSGMKITSDSEAHIEEKKKWAIYLNLGVLCLVWFFIFSPYMALEVLQSSLNPEAGLGVTAISVLYATKIISSFFGPLIIHKLTAKWTLVIGWICHTLFVAANYYPTWWTLVTAGVLVGAAVGPIWICNGVYITTLATEMAEITGWDKQTVMSKFYGIFGLVPPMTSICGNFVSSFILKTFTKQEVLTANSLHNNGTGQYTVVDGSNSTYVYKNLTLQCGAKYCPYEYDDYLTEKIEIEKGEVPTADPVAVYILLTIYLTMSICGVILTVLLLKNIKKTDNKNSGSLCSQLVNNFKSLMHYKLLILVPVFFFIYMRRATVSASFTKAFITCSLGIDMVGYIMAARGLASMAASYISGQLGQHAHRNWQFLTALILWLGVTTVFLMWEPQPDQLWAFFLIAIVAGMVNSVDIVQFQAFMGSSFSDKKAEAFAAQNFWSGIAMALVFGYSSHLCFSLQVYILTGILGLSITGYMVLFLHLRKTATNIAIEEADKDDQTATKA